ncbi:MAG TPA: HlyD family efflux transporter periplasmic adaptor subunit, partial [Planctomycetaceae bacterium]|nr:HlyD family efflux transporter periplasmic adaptor subunit [Planctomycetaceae bacterium]
MEHRAKLLWVGAVGLLAVGYLLGSRGGQEAPAETAEKPALTEESSAPTVWTCSMHPEIRRDRPGNCPKCGMKLIPLVPAGSGGGMSAMANLRQLVVSPEARALLDIRSVPVQRRYVMAQVEMVGKVDYDETRLGYITAWVSGRLDRMFVDYTGVEVKKGDHMVLIYSEELYSAQEELIQALKYAPTRSGQTATGGIDLLESSREKLRLLGLTDEQLREIELRGKPSPHVTIYAPVGGIVIEKLRQEGDRVARGDRIYTVADLSHVWVKLDAYESDLMWLRYGQEVTFSTEAYPGQVFRGRISFIDPVLNDKTRTVKVRVNVANEQGKLKPDMFVRAMVQSTVAAGGKVVDPELAGKWVGPMHPEVIKDEPGLCDVCGMPLVRAETLGYVSVDAGKASKPLVIPVSAALVTGRRAVVYVEVPDAEEPTFEGREVLLGPRAGDYYIVRRGLAEGERVVYKGNFTLDSEIQIQAKPSMMTPEGGGGGGHQHGGAVAKAAGGAPAPKPEIPGTFFAQVERLEDASEAVGQAIGLRDLDQVRAAFDAVGQALEAVDAGLLKGHPAMLWKDLAMVLANDVAEGAEVERLRDAQRVHEMLEEHLDRLRRQLPRPAEPAAA